MRARLCILVLALFVLATGGGTPVDGGAGNPYSHDAFGRFAASPGASNHAGEQKLHIMFSKPFDDNATYIEIATGVKWFGRTLNEAYNASAQLFDPGKFKNENATVTVSFHDSGGLHAGAIHNAERTAASASVPVIIPYPLPSKHVVFEINTAKPGTYFVFEGNVSSVRADANGTSFMIMNDVVGYLLIENRTNAYAASLDTLQNWILYRTPDPNPNHENFRLTIRLPFPGANNL